MDQNILEAQNYITRFVTKEFDAIFVNVHLTIENLVKEVEDLINQVETHLQELKEKERQLRKNLIGHAIFGVINVAAAALSLIGPAGSAAALALGAASGIAQNLVISDVNIDPKNPLSLPNGIYNLLHDLKELRQSRQKGSMEVIIFTCDTFLKMPYITQREKDEVNNIRKSALKLPDVTNVQEIDKIVQSCIKGLKDVSKNLKPGENVELGQLLNNTLSVLSYAEKVSKIAAPILDALKNYTNNQEKLKLVLDMILKDEKALRDLSDFEEGIYELIVPLLDDLQKDMSMVEDELRTQSAVSLIVKRWEITRHVSNIGNLILRFTEGFKVEKEFLKYFNQLNEAANLVVSLFEQIQYYQEHKQFAGYIADLNQVGGANIPDSSIYKAELASLKRSMIVNTVRGQCNTIVTSFTQQVFPFAHNHLGSLFNLNGKFCEGSQKTVINTIDTIKKQLEKIRDTILSNEDEYVHVGVFDSTFVSTAPFAVWSNDTYSMVINNLMKGQSVVIFAPIVGKKNAVKFNKIGIRFKRTDGGSQLELENDLKWFTMEQTHFGNSIYKCDNFQFMIRSTPLTLSYSLENDKNGDPLFYNKVYEKLRKGDIALSPYTMWRLTLKISYRKVDDFSILEKYTKSNVNLELFGNGQFVEKEVDVCNTPLEQYYDFNAPWIAN